MTVAKKLMLPLFGLGLIASISVANAAENAVLFKIHDIVPVKNPDGLVTSCDLGATFYNRSNLEVSDAALNLTWQDEVVAEAIDQEQRNEREARRLRNTKVSRYRTADLNSTTVSLSIKLPPLKPHQQISLKSKVSTERCYLLLNEMDIVVNNCTANVVNVAVADSAKAAQANPNCQKLFKFVSVKNPEYYSEFKEASPEELLSQEQSMQEQHRQEIQNLYNDSVTALNELSSTFSQD